MYSWIADNEEAMESAVSNVGQPPDRRAGAAARNLAAPREVIARFCRRHHMRRLAFFGSVLREDFRPESDVDVLVEYEPGYVPGYSFFAHQDELSGILGRGVDLNMPEDLSRYFRDEVMREAEHVYVAP